MAQSGSAPGLGPGGRKFESCCPDHYWLLSVLSVDPRTQLFLQNSAAYSALIKWTEVDKNQQNRETYASLSKVGETLAYSTTNYRRLIGD